MVKKPLEDQMLRYTLVNPGNLFDAAFKIIRAEGIVKAMQGKPMSDYDLVHVSFEDPVSISSYFEKGGKITQSTIEALSMAYLASYYKSRAAPDKRYYVGTDIEDRRSRSETEREQFLSDGTLVEAREGVDGLKDSTFFPFQQVIAQNIGYQNIGKPIEDIIIQEASKKIARRGTYNGTSGLLVSVLSSNNGINLQKILDVCDFKAYTTAFMLIFEDDGKTCTVIHLDNLTSAEDLLRQSARITPTLKST